jgi:hypothetical protein
MKRRLKVTAITLAIITGYLLVLKGLNTLAETHPQAVLTGLGAVLVVLIGGFVWMSVDNVVEK